MTKTARQIAKEIEKVRDALPAIIAAIAEEREACAKIADDLLIQTGSTAAAGMARLIAERIRARGN